MYTTPNSGMHLELSQVNNYVLLFYHIRFSGRLGYIILEFLAISQLITLQDQEKQQIVSSKNISCENSDRLVATAALKVLKVLDSIRLSLQQFATFRPFFWTR